MKENIFDVRYSGVYSQPQHRKDLIVLFIELEEKFKFASKIKVSIEEQIVSDPQFKSRDSTEILEDGKVINCKFYGDRYRDDKFNVSDAPNLIATIKGELEKLLQNDLQRFDELNINKEEE